MDDLISRRAAIDALRTCYDTETISMDNGDEHINYGDAVGEIEQLPSAQPEQRWIPVSERLPDNYMCFYATCKSRIDQRENWVIEGYYTNMFSWGEVPMIVSGDAEVIAWMPKELPEPYKEDHERVYH